QHQADMVRIAAAPAPALAKSLIDDAEATATRYHLAATTAQAVLAEATGDSEHAATLYAEAAAGWTTYHHVLEHALTLLGQGRCLAQLGRPDAEQVLRVAHQHLKTLGARPTAAEAMKLLERHG
ncbi:MAG: hypothetical protein K0S88_2752, partial [Actinomycetia bacterium]|nr:hypothetical protein [Actinomycetes bacterium]